MKFLYPPSKRIKEDCLLLCKGHKNSQQLYNYYRNKQIKLFTYDYNLANILQVYKEVKDNKKFLYLSYNRCDTVIFKHGNPYILGVSHFYTPLEGIIKINKLLQTNIKVPQSKYILIDKIVNINLAEPIAQIRSRFFKKTHNIKTLNWIQDVDIDDQIRKQFKKKIELIFHGALTGNQIKINEKLNTIIQKELYQPFDPLIFQEKTSYAPFIPKQMIHLFDNI